MGFRRNKALANYISMPEPERSVCVEEVDNGCHDHDHETMNTKRRTIGDRFGLLKRMKQPKTHACARGSATTYKNGSINDKEKAFARSTRSNKPTTTAPSSRRRQEGGRRGRDDCLGDIPRSITTTTASQEDQDDDIMLMMTLSIPPSSSFDDSIGSPCDEMCKRLILDSITAQASSVEDILSTSSHQLISSNSPPCKHKAEKARIEILRTIMRRTPSMDHLAYYIAALTPTISPDPSADLPLIALHCLLSLSDHSCDKRQCIAMVRPSSDITAAATTTTTTSSKENEVGSSSSTTATLVPTILAFLQRCPRNSPAQNLTLLILNNLSIPAENKRLVALEYGGARMLGKLLSDDPGCQMLLIIMINLTFGDERYPLVDPEDPVTRRLIARVVSFLEVWKRKGLPMDFRPLYGVNTGLCTI